jgi:FkbM family methyltransferase
MIRTLLHRCIYGRNRWQWIFERCHSAALSGMNHGWVDISVDGETYLLRRVRSEMETRKVVIFDVGANRGEYAENVLRIFGGEAELHCFEPSPTACGGLERYLSQHSNVRVHAFGLGDSPGDHDLHAAHVGGTGSSLHLKEFPDSPWVYDQRERVELRRLDDVCAELDISRIDLLKIDTEGHEFQVLRGARRMIEERRISRIQFEFGEGSVASRTYFLDFYRLLTPHYRLFRLLRDGLRPIDEYRLHLEVFVTTNYVALLKTGEGEHVCAE